MNMKKTLSLLFVFLLILSAQAQVLNVKKCTQEQDQWCWAGVSQCVLDYYGKWVEQCDIADYARSVITWHNFGSDYCCDKPNGLCNYWNYAWGYPGSIQDILVHFNNITNNGVSNPLSQTLIQAHLTANRPFIIRWGWVTGGGHFVVGHGMENETIYYMDPWFGEGHKFASYSWVLNDGWHEWTHTNVLAVSPPTGVAENVQKEQIFVYPNPTTGQLRIANYELQGKSLNEIEIQVFDMMGKIVGTSRDISYTNNEIVMDISSVPSGIYFLKIDNKTVKIIKE